MVPPVRNIFDKSNSSLSSGRVVMICQIIGFAIRHARNSRNLSIIKKALTKSVMWKI